MFQRGIRGFRILKNPGKWREFAKKIEVSKAESECVRDDEKEQDAVSIGQVRTNFHAAVMVV